MGAAPSTGPMEASQIRTCFDPADNFKAGRGSLCTDEDPESPQSGPGCDALGAYSIIGGQPHRIEAAMEALKKTRSQDKEKSEDEKQRDRSLGCMLGNVVGDALGAPMEFSAVRYNMSELKGLGHSDMWQAEGHNSFGLKPGQWTDDGSMGLCLMDSLLCCDGFNPYDLRQRFHAWNTYGYNNSFGRDPERDSRGSIGLGGNISASMSEWERLGSPQTTAGDRFTSGNGSLMRNGAVPVWFRSDTEAGMAAAAAQSRTTHGGDEAAELCRLLTFICISFINGAGRDLLEDLSGFESPLYGVTCLANSKNEEAHEQNADPIFGGLERRRWDWKDPNFRYCSARAEENPGYVGSYSMDCMAMALHCVYSTNSFADATLKAANLCGDADTVCAVTGQLAGALYGISAIPHTWLEKVQQWDGCTIAARALMLYNRESVGRDDALSDAACASAELLGTSWTTARKRKAE